jgi:hypothetical protein
MVKFLGRVAAVAIGGTIALIAHDILQPYVEEAMYGDVDMSDLFGDEDEEEPEEEKAPIDYDVVSEEKTEEAPEATEEPEVAGDKQEK